MVPVRKVTRRNSSAPRYQLHLSPRELTPTTPVTTTFPNGTTTTSAGAVASTAAMYGPSRILPRLYLGSHDDACDQSIIEHLEIKWVLNVAEECEVKPWLSEMCQVKHVMLKDHSDQPIHHHFGECAKFIQNAIDRNENILVHCKMGFSRAASIVIAYLMISSSEMGSRQSTSESSFSTFSNQSSQQQHNSYSYTEAFDRVKQCRPLVSPNLGFGLALRSLEQRISPMASMGDDDSGDGDKGGKGSKMKRVPSSKSINSNNSSPHGEMLVGAAFAAAADEEPSSSTSVNSEWLFVVSPSISVYS